MLFFACQIWCPSQQKYGDIIESIQKQFIKFICPNNSANNPDNPFQLRPYIDRCNEFNVQTLQRRRMNACIFFLHDVISGRINSANLRKRIEFVRITYFTRSPDFIKLNTHRLECTDRSPLRTAFRLYNLVALFIDVTTDRNTFRRLVTQLPDSTFNGLYK